MIIDRIVLPTAFDLWGNQGVWFLCSYRQCQRNIRYFVRALENSSELVLSAEQLDGNSTECEKWFENFNVFCNISSQFAGRYWDSRSFSVWNRERCVEFDLCTFSRPLQRSLLRSRTSFDSKPDQFVWRLYIAYLWDWDKFKDANGLTQLWSL